MLRASRQSDRPAILALYGQAFQEEDLSALVASLLSDGEAVLSLVIEEGSPAEIIGHVAFTHASLASRDSACVALLGPLGVAAHARGRGLARRLVAEGCSRLAQSGTAMVLVLGDPAFYARLGFEPEATVLPPYALPDAWSGAWQSRTLSAAGAGLGGALTLPDYWRDPALWLP